MIVLKLVNTYHDAELLRQHRNACRSFMTRSNEYITSEQQVEWFKTSDTKYDLYLVYNVEYGSIIYDVGYGVIHKLPDQSLLTGGLLPEYRGRNLGQELFQNLINICPKTKPIRLEVLKTNTRALIVYIKLGFKIISEDSRIHYMEFDNESVI